MDPLTGRPMSRCAPSVALIAALLLLPAMCAAQVQHRVDLNGLYEGIESAGHPGHGAVVADWRMQAPQRSWSTSLSLHSDTLTARGDIRLGDANWFLEPELRGQTPTAGLAPDYIVRGERWGRYGYSASYVTASLGVRGELGRHHTVRATLRGRRWFFGELGSTGDIDLPTTRWVAEPRLSYTWWNVRDDASIGSAARPMRRVRGLAAYVELGVDVRDQASGAVVDDTDSAELGDGRWPGDTVVFMVRQELHHGAWLFGRTRWQLGEWAGWGVGEDDLTRARIGGTQTQYFVPLAGAPWGAFISGHYLVVQPSLRFGVGRDHELGVYGDVAALADLRRTGSLDDDAAGVVGGVGALADLRWRHTQVDLRAGWTPPRDLWSSEPHFTAALGLGWTWQGE